MEALLQMASGGKCCVCRPVADPLGRHGGQSRALVGHLPVQQAHNLSGWSKGRFAVDTLVRQQLSAVLLAGPSEADLDTAPFSGGSASLMPPETSAAEPQLPQHVTRTLWDSVPRPLLRIGKSGVQGSHVSSLGELLAAHGLVKVQLNAVNSDVHAVGRDLADGTGGTLVQVKGRTLLLGAPQRDTDQLMAIAATSNDRAEAATLCKMAAKEQQKNGQMPAAVTAKLQWLISGHVVEANDFDSHSLRALAALSEQSALAVLGNCTKVRLRGVRNRSAWLTSQCRRMSESAARQPA